MWKSTTTKVFLSFCALILMVTSSLTLMFASALIQQRESYVYDLLSSRSRVIAAEMLTQIQAGKAIEELVQSKPYLLITSRGEVISGKSHSFEAKSLEALTPPSGSLVTSCKDRFQNDYLCSFVPIGSTGSWLVDIFPRESLLQVLSQLTGRVIYAVLLFVSISLFVAFIMTRFILYPLQRFVKASQEIAQGNYDQVDLPTHRGDEVGKLSDAFQRMVFELKEREQNLARTGLKLAHSARLASIGQMGASIAHEVKNPLTAMLGHAKLILQKNKDPQLNESAEIIWKESERCNQIIQQMLRYSRNEAEEFRPYRIKELLDSSILLVKAEAVKRRVQIELKIENDEVLLGRAQQVQQVCLNLILNAIQAMVQEGRIKITTHRLGNNLCIDFEDNGPGIPIELQARIFEPFFTTKHKSEGTGLGLSIAQNLIEEQAGSLELVESMPGKTLFRIRLPLELDSVASS